MPTISELLSKYADESITQGIGLPLGTKLKPQEEVMLKPPVLNTESPATQYLWEKQRTPYQPSTPPSPSGAKLWENPLYPKTEEQQREWEQRSTLVGKSMPYAAGELSTMLPMTVPTGALAPLVTQIGAKAPRLAQAVTTAFNLAGADTTGVVAPDIIGQGLSKIGQGVSKLGKKIISKIPQPVKTIGKEVFAIEGKPPAPAPKLVPEIQSAADELINILESSSKPTRLEKEAIKGEWRSKQARKLAEIQKSYTFEEGSIARQLASLRGKIPDPTFKLPDTPMLAENYNKLQNYIRLSEDISPFDKENIALALEKVFEGQSIPTLSEIKWLEDAFGSKFANEIRKKVGLGTKIWKEIIDVAGLPRALMASIDQSAILRQAVIPTIRHPLQAAKSAGSAFKATVYSKWAKEIEESIISDPMFKAYQESGGYFAPLNLAQDLNKYEEQFMSKIAKHIPGIRHSERGYVTYLNKMRFDTFKGLVKSAENLGVDVKKPNILDDFGKLVNLATGRGSLGKFEKGDLAPILNAVMFSPRLAMSRIQLPKLVGDLAWNSISKIPATRTITKGALKGQVTKLTENEIKKLTQQRQVARLALKEAASSIAAFVAFGATVLGLGKLATGGQVETDVRSSDAYKLKVGNTRIDPWGGYQQYVRLLGQLISNERKATTTGGIQPTTRLDTITNFLKSKGSPAATLALDILSGKDYRGQPIDLKTQEGISKQAYERLVPLFIQDMYDAFKDAGLMGTALASPGFFGMGISTYPDTLIDKEAQIGSVINKKVKGETKQEAYTISNYGGDIGKLGYTKGNLGSPLTKFYFTSKDIIKPYESISTDKRINYREQNPKVDAALFFWGKVDTLRSDKAREYVKQWLAEYGLEESALHKPITGTTSNKPNLKLQIKFR